MVTMIGRTLGNYKILENLGEVYKAVDSKLGRTVVIKVLPAELTGNSRDSTESCHARPSI